MRRNGIGIPGRNRFCKINARIAADLLDRVIAQTEADFLGELEELFQRTTDIKLDPKRRAVRPSIPRAVFRRSLSFFNDESGLLKGMVA